MTDFIFHDVKQNTEEWDALRLGKATFSNYGKFMANFGKAFGEPAKKYALQIALERLTCERADDGYTNEHMGRGHEQEPVARMMYEEQTFSTVTNGGFFDCGEFGGSPDGLVGNGRIEIKSVMPEAHYANLVRKSFDPAYKWQLVGNLEGSGGDWIDFVSYCSRFPIGKQLIVYRTYKEQFEDEIKMIKERRAEFLELVKVTESNIRDML